VLSWGASPSPLALAAELLGLTPNGLRAERMKIQIVHPARALMGGLSEAPSPSQQSCSGSPPTGSGLSG